MQPISRRLFLGASAALGFTRTAGAAEAAFPTRPVTLIVPFPAGNVSDTLARHVGVKLGKKWDVPVVVENVQGASGTIGILKALRSPPDGHTFFVGTLGSAVIAPALQTPAPYDPKLDLTALTYAAPLPLLLVAHPSLPAKSLPELVKYAKDNPGKISYGSLGIGSTPHLAMEILKDWAGIDMVHVPYKGSSQASTDLLSGRVQLMLDTVPPSLPHVRAGKLRALAVSGTRRIGAAPEVPCLAEVGMKETDVTPWTGFFAMKGLPEPVVQQLTSELRSVLDETATRSSLGALGLDVSSSSREEFQKFVSAEVDKWGGAIRKHKDQK
jgi:tripartite-type tricarboxylate transporter receptor subunit TctC